MNAGIITPIRHVSSTDCPCLLFTYGTLMRKKGNHHLMGDSEFLGKAVTQRPKFAMRDVGFPIATENGSGQVVGEIFCVRDPQTLKRVDGLEGHPDWYERKMFDFLLTSQRTGETTVTSAWMYVQPERLARNRGHVVYPNEHGHLVWPGALR